MYKHSPHPSHSATRHHKTLTLLVIVVLVGIAVALLIAGDTTSWPTASCTVVGSRVVRDGQPTIALAGRAPVVIMFRGEYHLRYVVKGREYFVYANSGWFDEDRRFIEAKVHSLPTDCAYTIRYNPHNPAEAIVTSKD